MFTKVKWNYKLSIKTFYCHRKKKVVKFLQVGVRKPNRDKGCSLDDSKDDS